MRSDRYSPEQVSEHVNGSPYVYFYLRQDGSPYYVGKGTKYRAFRKGCPVLKNILLQHYESEDEAFEAEKFFIEHFGRKDLGTGILRNLTEGGDGISGLPRTPEHQRKISEASRGKKRSKEVCRRLSESHKDQKPTEKSRKCLELGRGPKSEEWKAKLRSTWTPERRKNQSDYSWQRKRIQIL